MTEFTIAILVLLGATLLGIGVCAFLIHHEAKRKRYPLPLTISWKTIRKTDACSRGASAWKRLFGNRKIRISDLAELLVQREYMVGLVNSYLPPDIQYRLACADTYLPRGSVGSLQHSSNSQYLCRWLRDYLDSREGSF